MQLQSIISKKRASMKRNTTILSVIIAITLSISGCAKRASFAPPPPPPETILGATESDSLQYSLFKGDQNVLSDQDIARILGMQLNLSERHRLAILNLSSYSPWSEDIADMEAKNF